MLRVSHFQPFFCSCGFLLLQLGEGPESGVGPDLRSMLGNCIYSLHPGLCQHLQYSQHYDLKKIRNVSWKRLLILWNIAWASKQLEGHKEDWACNTLFMLTHSQGNAFVMYWKQKQISVPTLPGNFSLFSFASIPLGIRNIGLRCCVWKWQSHRWWCSDIVKYWHHNRHTHFDSL